MNEVIINDKVKCVNADCFDVFPTIADESVDMILCDLPYGLSTTTCKWDKMLPLDRLWEQYKRIIKGNGAIVLFGTEPFSSMLRVSNIEMFKYDWIWVKNHANGFVNAKRKPMQGHETISVFSTGICANTKYKERDMVYYPQGLVKSNRTHRNHYKSEESKNKENTFYRKSHKECFVSEWANYPTTILKFNRVNKAIHPTEKPVPLLEYLIKTYTKEGDLVLDNCAGSFSTGEACMNTQRKFIGVEKEERFFNIGIERLEKVKESNKCKLFLP